MDPIHQFQIVNLFPLGKIGNSEIAFTNSAAVHADRGRRPHWFLVGGTAGGSAGAHAPAIGRGAVLRIRRQHAALDRRPRGHAVLPLRVHAVHVRAAAEHDRAHPLRLHGHQPHHHHRGAGDDGVPDRAGLRADAARPALLQPVRAEGRADLHPAADRLHRGPVVHLAPDLAQRASVRQHAGRPHHAEGVRRLHHPAGRRARRASAGPAACCRSR